GARLWCVCLSEAKAARRARSPSPYCSTATSCVLANVRCAFDPERFSVPGSSERRTLSPFANFGIAILLSHGSRMPGPGDLLDPDSRAPQPGGGLRELARRLLLDPCLEHAAGGDLRQELVGARLLVERLVHLVLDAVVAAVVRELARGSVGRDLVVLDALRRADQGCVLRGRVAAFPHQLVALGDHGLALLRRHGDAELPEGL